MILITITTLITLINNLLILIHPENPNNPYILITISEAAAAQRSAGFGCFYNFDDMRNCSALTAPEKKSMFHRNTFSNILCSSLHAYLIITLYFHCFYAHICWAADFYSNINIFTVIIIIVMIVIIVTLQLLLHISTLFAWNGLCPQCSYARRINPGACLSARVLEF